MDFFVKVVSQLYRGLRGKSLIGLRMKDQEGPCNGGKKRPHILYLGKYTTGLMMKDQGGQSISQKKRVVHLCVVNEIAIGIQDPIAVILGVPNKPRDSILLLTY